MTDPHVVKLYYRVVKDEDTDFRDPPPIEIEKPEFRLRLDEQGLTAEMIEHYPSVDEARAVVEPSLRSWEVFQEITLGRSEISFEFNNAEIIDRNPPPPGVPRTVSASATCVFEARAGMKARAHVTHVKYPKFPENFELSPDMETIRNRYRGYRKDKEPLAAMAYFCLTVVEGSAREAKGRRKLRDKAEEKYKIDGQVLDRLGKLTSRRGDTKTARKMDNKSTMRPFTPAEVSWIEAAVKLLARRLGEWAFDPSRKLPPLTLNDLPKL